jgi:beta-glucanase (GH16 family)
VDWEPGAITWYVDGVVRAQYTDVSNITSKPMFIILNLAIGGVGSWPGPPDDTTPFPSYFQIDYVRVWQQSSPLPTYLPYVINQLRQALNLYK